MTVIENSSSAYDDLAPYYDQLQADVDHQAFARYLDQVFREELKSTQALGEADQYRCLDLGCGTGSLVIALDQLGYECIGIDYSEAMIEEAREKAWEDGRGSHIQFLHEDIRYFDLDSKQNAITLVLDTVNHLADRDTLIAVLKRCRQHLADGGLLLFDVLTEERARETLGNQQFFVLEDDFALFWSNQYNHETKRTRAELSLFEAEAESNLYSRRDAVVEEQIYSHEEITAILEASGFQLLRCQLVDAAFQQLNQDENEAAAGRMLYFAK